MKQKRPSGSTGLPVIRTADTSPPPAEEMKADQANEASLPSWAKWPWGSFLTVAIALIAYTWAFRSTVRESAREAVLDPEFIAKVSKRLRPYLIIDSSERVLADYGVGEGLSGFSCSVSTNSVDLIITLQFNRHIQYAPIVRPLDRGWEMLGFDRGHGHDWIVTVRRSSIMIPMGGIYNLTWGVIDTNSPSRFLIELLP